MACRLIARTKGKIKERMISAVILCFRSTDTALSRSSTMPRSCSKSFIHGAGATGVASLWQTMEYVKPEDQNSLHALTCKVIKYTTKASIDFVRYLE